MPIITISTAAGSSGKSTTAVALANLLAHQGIEVILIDADPQSDATLSLGIDPYADHLTIADVLTDHGTLEDATRPTDYGVALIPARPNMSGRLAEFGQRRGADMRLQPLLAPLGETHTVIIDCPGDATNAVTVAALCAADHVLSTTYASGKESKGLAEIEGLVTEFAGLYRLPTQFSAVIPCAVQPPSRNVTAHQHLATIRAAYGEFVTPPVRWSELVINAYDQRQPVTHYAHGSAVARDYQAVLQALQDRGVL